jgi:hydrogenase maturation protease
MNAQKHVLVAGIGNVFLGDDGFGVAVAQQFDLTSLPDGVRVVDYGIRGLHLAMELLDPPDLLILVDTAKRTGEPGTLYLIDPDLDVLPKAAPDAHTMDPCSVFASLKYFGGTIPRTLIVACEPQTLAEGMRLSEPVTGAVKRAIMMIRELITQCRK